MILAKRLFGSDNVPEDRIWHGKKDSDDDLTYQWVTYYGHTGVYSEESFEVSYFLPINNLSNNVTYFLYDCDQYAFKKFDDYYEKIVKIKCNGFQEMLEAIENL